MEVGRPWIPQVLGMLHMQHINAVGRGLKARFLRWWRRRHLTDPGHIMSAVQPCTGLGKARQRLDGF